MPIHHTFTVHAQDQDKRLDQFLQLHLHNYSRTALANFIKQGYVTVNSKAITKPGQTVIAGQIITLTIVPQESFILPQETAQTLVIPIIAQTDDFIVINKPAGLITHPTSSTKKQSSVSGWAQALFPDIAQVGDAARPGIVHRLDTDTSGLMIIARTPEAYTTLSAMFKDRSIKKEYLAVVAGHPEKSGTISLTLGRHPTKRNTVTVTKSGRPALTHYNVQEYFTDSALLNVHLLTGRTHQIRVHCKAMNHPILGDTVYGKKTLLIKRQALHAHKLSFTYKGVSYAFVAPLPADMHDLLSALHTKGRFDF